MRRDQIIFVMDEDPRLRNYEPEDYDIWLQLSDNCYAIWTENQWFNSDSVVQDWPSRVEIPDAEIEEQSNPMAEADDSALRTTAVQLTIAAFDLSGADNLVVCAQKIYDFLKGSK